MTIAKSIAFLAFIAIALYSTWRAVFLYERIDIGDDAALARMSPTARRLVADRSAPLGMRQTQASMKLEESFRAAFTLDDHTDERGTL